MCFTLKNSTAKTALGKLIMLFNMFLLENVFIHSHQAFNAFLFIPNVFEWSHNKVVQFCFPTSQVIKTLLKLKTNKEVQ